MFLTLHFERLRNTITEGDHRLIECAYFIGNKLPCNLLGNDFDPGVSVNISLGVHSLLQDLANAVWALTRLNHGCGSEFREALVCRVQKGMHIDHPSILAKLVWTFPAVFNGMEALRKDVFEERLLAACLEKWRLLGPWDLTQIITGVARMGYWVTLQSKGIRFTQHYSKAIQFVGSSPSSPSTESIQTTNMDPITSNSRQPAEVNISSHARTSRGFNTTIHVDARSNPVVMKVLHQHLESILGCIALLTKGQRTAIGRAYSELNMNVPPAIKAALLKTSTSTASFACKRSLDTQDEAVSKHSEMQSNESISSNSYR